MLMLLLSLLVNSTERGRDFLQKKSVESESQTTKFRTHSLSAADLRVGRMMLVLAPKPEGFGFKSCSGVWAGISMSLFPCLGEKLKMFLFAKMLCRTRKLKLWPTRLFWPWESLGCLLVLVSTSSFEGSVMQEEWRETSSGLVCTCISEVALVRYLQPVHSGELWIRICGKYIHTPSPSNRVGAPTWQPRYHQWSSKETVRSVVFSSLEFCLYSQPTQDLVPQKLHQSQIPY